MGDSFTRVSPANPPNVSAMLRSLEERLTQLTNKSYTLMARLRGPQPMNDREKPKPIETLRDAVAKCHEHANTLEINLDSAINEIGDFHG